MLNEEESQRAHHAEYDFDHPDAFDFDLLIETIRKLKEGKSVDVPIYNFVTHSREKRTVSNLIPNVSTFACLADVLFKSVVANGITFRSRLSCRRKCTALT